MKKNKSITSYLYKKNQSVNIRNKHDFFVLISNFQRVEIASLMACNE